MLDFSDTGDNYSWTPTDTQFTDYSTATSQSGHVVYGQPEAYVDVARSDGVTFGGIFSNVAAGADTLFSTYQKFYDLNSKIENDKFQRTVNEANRDLNKASTLGALDIKRAQIDANIAIEKARASRATGDALARVESAGASFVGASSAIKPIYIVGGLALIGLVLFMRKNSQ